MPTTQCKPLPSLLSEDIARFFKNIDKTPGQGPKGDCHRWIGSMFPNGYGRFHVHGRELKSHRVALFLHSGFDPYPLLACHTCDWEPCVRGEHLFRGTVLDNNRDRNAKGRSASGDNSGARTHPERIVRGERHHFWGHPEMQQGDKNGRAKLTNEQVIEIRRREHGGGVSFAELSREFSLTKENISMIVRRKTWTHI